MDDLPLLVQQVGVGPSHEHNHGGPNDDERRHQHPVDGLERRLGRGLEDPPVRRHVERRMLSRTTCATGAKLEILTTKGLRKNQPAIILTMK